jgi:hypothetical protein
VAFQRFIVADWQGSSADYFHVSHPFTGPATWGTLNDEHRQGL